MAENLALRLDNPTLSLPPHVLSALDSRGHVKDARGLMIRAPLAPAIHAECITLKHEFERALTPATKQQIIVELARLRVHFWQPDRPQKHYEIMLEDYAADLGDIPPDLLAEACARWRRKGKFWPKVSELLELAAPLARERRALLTRVGRALDPNYQPPRMTKAEVVHAGEVLALLGPTLSRAVG